MNRADHRALVDADSRGIFQCFRRAYPKRLMAKRPFTNKIMRARHRQHLTDEGTLLRRKLVAQHPAGNGKPTAIDDECLDLRLQPRQVQRLADAEMHLGDLDRLQGLPPTAGLGGTCPDCNITMTAAGTVDGEQVGMDSWYIATKDSVSAPVNGCGTAANVPAGVPTNTFNDVNCD